MTRDVLVFPDDRAAARALADATVEALRATLARAPRFSWVVSGGKSPEPYWDALASGYADSVPWDRVHVFWADERAVAPDDPDSNVGAVRRHLLARLRIPPENVHPIRGGVVPASAAAEQYERELRAYFDAKSAMPDHAFDFVTLGLGPDGHTASLFPAPFAQPPPDAWVLATAAAPVAPKVPRITLGPALLNRSQEAAFLVTGEEKRAILSRALASEPGPASELPAARIQATGRTRWFVDEAALGGRTLR